MLDNGIGQVVRFISIKQREDNLGMEIEEQLRRIIKADREDFDQRLTKLKANYERKLRLLRRENTRLIQVLRNQAGKRPADEITPKLLRIIQMN